MKIFNLLFAFWIMASTLNQGFAQMELEGKRQEFYENGQVRLIAHYENNQLSGKYEEYYENGKLKRKASYKNGRLHGKEYSYYPDGKLAFEQSVLSGKIQGWVKEYYPSGILKGKVRYENSLQEGILQEFYESGQVKQEALYDHGEIISVKDFDVDGNVLSEVRSASEVAMRNSLLNSFLGVVLVVFVLGCGSGSIDAQKEELAKKILQGREVYLSYGCATCHGKNGDGQGITGHNFDPPPTNFHDPKSYHHGITKDRVRWNIRNGITTEKSAMPAFSHITEMELNCLMEYIVSLQNN